MKSEKETLIAHREAQVKSREKEMTEKVKELQLREESLKEQEAAMKDKRNELFRSWDALSAKIYDVERECLRVKGLQRQLDEERERTRREIDEKYRDMVYKIT